MKVLPSILSGAWLTVALSVHSPGLNAEEPSLNIPELTSVDHRGDCRKGRPNSDGQTRILDDGRTLELIAHGSEYGHHCGEDQGRFAFVELIGEFDVAVQVVSVTNEGAKRYDGLKTPAKTGIMAREGNDPGARYVAIWTVSNDDPAHYPDAVHFDLRKSPGAWLGSEPKGEFVYGYVNRRVPDPPLFERDFPNVWLRLQRKGNRFLAFISNDGKDWKPTSTPAHKIEFPESLSVGVALSSAPEGGFNAKSTARFRNLTGLDRPAGSIAP